MMRLVTGMILALILAVLAGCSAVGHMPVEFDDYGREFVPAADEALVYIVRPTSLGKAVKFTAFCDGDSIGATGGGRYIFTVQDPGPHVFLSQAENTSELPIVLEGGQIYYLEQKVKMGVLQARAHLERLSDAEGKEKLAQCKLSLENAYDIPGSAEFKAEYLRKKQLRDEERQADNLEY